MVKLFLKSLRGVGRSPTIFGLGITYRRAGAPPACPVGCACTDVMTARGMMNDCGGDGFCGNPLGAVCVIPTCAIACFTHNAI